MSSVLRFGPKNRSFRNEINSHRAQRSLLLGATFVFGLAILLWQTNQPGTLQTLADVRISLPDLPAMLAPQPILADSPAKLALQTRAAILVDSESGLTLFSKQPDTRVPIASTTKIMTALITRQRLELDQTITITKEDVSIIGSDMQLRSGEEISVYDLLAGLLLSSGNDAAQALARAIGGTTEGFAQVMNEKARELGMTDTTYRDPAGLDDTGQSTPFDLSIAARALLADPVLAQLVQRSELQVASADGRVVHNLKNSNRLVGEFHYLGALGVKTGFTPEAGHCLVAAAERDGHRLIAVILHTDADTISASAIEARKLLDWGWQNVSWRTPDA